MLLARKAYGRARQDKGMGRFIYPVRLHAHRNLKRVLQARSISRQNFGFPFSSSLLIRDAYYLEGRRGSGFKRRRPNQSFLKLSFWCYLHWEISCGKRADMSTV